MSATAIQRDFLARAGQLLLEYNASSREIDESLTATARPLTSQKFDVAVTYNGVAVSLGDEAPVIKPVNELRYNQALQANLHAILRQIRGGQIDTSAALERLNRAEGETPSHPRLMVAVLLGLAAASLARILGADFGAMAIAGLSSAAGLIARKALGSRHFALLVLPFAAAFTGAVLGGIAIRCGWTDAPGLAIIVPSLMLVPGPHLLNGLFDLIDNYVPMAIARLALATGILVACALGIVWGIELTLSEVPPATEGWVADPLNLFSDMFLAALVTIGFAVFYNATWQQTWLAAIGGAAGHGTRFLALGADYRVEIATLFGGLVVGTVAACIARSHKTPIAVIAFAGAVTMMPGVQMYRALGGAVQLVRLKSDINLNQMAATLGDALQSSLVVAALGLGLIIATRSVSLLPGTYDAVSRTQS
jgi:uncharacterized membrane protein YjjP (DUF1212 family)